MRRAACIALIAAAAGCQKNASTPAGTEILRWDAPTSLPDVTRVSTDVRIHARPERKGQAVFAVHVETGSAAQGAESSPLSVRVTVERNSDWTFDASCGAPSPTISCAVRMRYEDSFNEVKAVLALEIAGDGTVHATLPGGSATFE